MYNAQTGIITCWGICDRHIVHLLKVFLLSQILSNFRSNFDLGGSGKQQLTLQEKLLDMWNSGQPAWQRRRRAESAALLGPRPSRRRPLPARTGPPRGGGPLPRRPTPLARSRPLDGAELNGERRGPPGDGGRARRRIRRPSRFFTAAEARTRAVLLLPTCREDTEHARTETTSG